MRKSLVIAHRGASGYAPENTIAAINKALDMKADGIEIDVHLSKDGHLVVCHDEKLGRTSNGSGYVKDYTLEELKKLDFGSWYSSDYANERIPTLEEVLCLLRDKNVLLHIEVKNNVIIYEEIEKALVNLVRKYEMVEKVIISSFNHYCVKEIKSLAPELKIGLLYSERLYKPGDYAKIVGAEAIHPYYITINSDSINNCKKNSILINAWTINNPEHIKEAVALGIDGVITNYPDIAKDIVSNMQT